MAQRVIISKEASLVCLAYFLTFSWKQAWNPVLLGQHHARNLNCPLFKPEPTNFVLSFFPTTKSVKQDVLSHAATSLLTQQKLFSLRKILKNVSGLISQFSIPSNPSFT